MSSNYEDVVLKIIERYPPVCKDRHGTLRAACAYVLSKVRNAEEYNELSKEERTNLLFYPLKCALETKEEQFLCSALDGIQNMISHSAFTGKMMYVPPSVPQPPRKKSFFGAFGGGQQNDSNPPSPMPKPDTDEPEPLVNGMVYVVSLNHQLPVDDVLLQIVRTLLTSVTSTECDIHGNVLLFTVRTIFEIFRTARTQPVQTSARAALTQIVGVVLSRAESSEDSQPPQNADDESEKVQFSSINEQDSFILLRRLCKLSMVEISTQGTADINEVKTKQLCLQLILHFLKAATPSVSTTSSFIIALRRYVCISVLQNCVLTIIDVSRASFEVLQHIVVEHRALLKQQVQIFFNNVVFPILDSSNAAYAQKDLVLCLLQRVCSKPQTAIDIFVNFDCVVGSVSLFEQMVDCLSKVVRTNHTIPNWVTPRQSEMLQVRAITALKQLIQSLSEWVDAQSEDAAPEEGAAASEDPAAAAAAAEDVDIEKMRKSKKTIEAVCEVFNTKKPIEGIDLALEVGVLEEKEPSAIARFLLTPGLNKVKIGEFLGVNKTFQKDVLREFIDLFDFTGLEIDEAMRTFLGKFKIMGEAEIVDRTMERFAERYCELNPSVFSSAGTAFVLAFSIMMLNTDLHSVHITTKMSLQEFTRNNRGIDDGGDLSPQFLEDIYMRIKKREIKLDGDEGKPAQHKREAEMTDVDRIFLSLEKKRQLNFKAESSSLQESSIQQLQTISEAQGGQLEGYIEAKTPAIVQPLWEAVWTAVLPALSMPMEESNEEAVVDACLGGIDAAMSLSCKFATATEREAFISTVSTFTHLTSYREIEYKSVRAIQTILKIATRDGDSLENSWYEVLKCISLLERLHILNSSAGSRPVTTRRAWEQQRMDQYNADMITQHVDHIQVDRIFTGSQAMEGRAVVFLVEHLCRVSAEELREPEPRTYSLQKLVEVTELNIGRMRYVWSQMWTFLSQHFISAGLDKHELVAMYTVDSLRQLAVKFLARGELGNFNFQRDVLKPFDEILSRTNSTKIKELVIASLGQMVEARGPNIMSGWKTVLNTLTKCAHMAEPVVVTAAFGVLQTIGLQFIGLVSSPELFCDTVIAFSSFGENHCSPDVATRAIEYVSLLASFLENGIPTEPFTSDANANAESVAEDYAKFVAESRPVKSLAADFKVEQTIYAGQSGIVNSPFIAVQSYALSSLFKMLSKAGTRYSPDQWRSVLGGTVFAVVDKIFSDILESQAQNDFGSDTYREHMQVLAQALDGCNDVVRQYQEGLVPMLGDIATLMLSCGKRNDAKVSQIGFMALATMFENLLSTGNNCPASCITALSTAVAVAAKSWIAATKKVLFSDAEGMEDLKGAELNVKVLSRLYRCLRPQLQNELITIALFTPLLEVFAESYSVASEALDSDVNAAQLEAFPQLQSVLLALEKESAESYARVASRAGLSDELCEWTQRIVQRFNSMDPSDAARETERSVLLEVLVELMNSMLTMEQQRFMVLVRGMYADLCGLIRFSDASLSQAVASVFLRVGPPAADETKAPQAAAPANANSFASSPIEDEVKPSVEIAESTDAPQPEIDASPEAAEAEAENDVQPKSNKGGKNRRKKGQ